MDSKITFEQVEKLRTHANVSYEDARAALEAAGGDMLEAIISLEKAGKARSQGAAYSTRDNSGEGAGWQYGDRQPKKSAFGEQMGKLWRAFCRLVGKGNTNNFEVWRQGRCAITFPVTLLVVFLLFFFWLTVPLLLVGLFMGCTYRFVGPDLDKSGINNVMDSAAETAEGIKKSIEEDRGRNA